MFVHSLLIEGVGLRRLGVSAGRNNIVRDHLHGRQVSPGEKDTGSIACKRARHSAANCASSAVNHCNLTFQQHGVLALLISLDQLLRTRKTPGYAENSAALCML